MSDASPPPTPTDDDPFVIPARLPYETTYQPFWSPLIGPIRTLLSMLPSHEDSRTGRQWAKRIQIGLGAVALGIVIFADGAMLRAVGALLVIGALSLPISKARKRSYTGRLRSLQEGRTKTITRPGRIVYDGYRILLEKEGSKLRRVLTDRDEHTLRLHRDDEHLYLKVEPSSSGRDSDAIWVGTADLESSDLDDDRDVTSIDDDTPDRPAIVEGEDWRRLWQVLLVS